MTRIVLSYRDYNREASAVTLRVPSQPSTEIGILTFEEAVDNLEAAINGVSIGLHTKTTLVWKDLVLAAPMAAAASENAQRERKWLVRFYDTVTFKVGSFEIPAADLSLLAENSEYMDISQGAGLNLKDTVEFYAVSPEGNQLIVFEVVHVGRNT